MRTTLSHALLTMALILAPATTSAQEEEEFGTILTRNNMGPEYLSYCDEKNNCQSARWLSDEDSGACTQQAAFNNAKAQGLNEYLLFGYEPMKLFSVVDFMMIHDQISGDEQNPKIRVASYPCVGTDGKPVPATNGVTPGLFCIRPVDGILSDWIFCAQGGLENPSHWDVPDEDSAEDQKAEDQQTEAKNPE